MAKTSRREYVMKKNSKKNLDIDFNYQLNFYVQFIGLCQYSI